MIRKLLRKRVQQVLKDANITDVGSDVFTRRSYQSDEQLLPIILIYPNTENAERFDESPKRYKRDYQITIEIQTTHDNDELLADELDDLASSVEYAIENDSILQGYDPYDAENDMHVEDTEVLSIEYDQEGVGSSPVGTCRIVFNISYIHDAYYQRENDPFNGLDTKWDIGDHGENQAADKIDLPQD